MVAAAVADAKARSSPPTLKAALSRSIAASAARARRRLAHASDAAIMGLLHVQASGDTYLCLFLAAAWLLVAGVAAVNLGRVFCGHGDCALIAAGGRLVCLAALAMVTFCAPATLVFVHRVAADTVEGRAPRGLAAAAEEVLDNRGGVMIGMLVSLPFYVLKIVGDLLLKGFSPAKGSLTEDLGSEMSAVGTIGKDALWCFVIIPAVALSVWRVTRPGWRRRSIIEENP